MPGAAPRAGEARTDAAGIAKTCFERRAGLAVDDRHLVAIAGKIMGAGYSDDTCAQDQDFHAPPLIPS